MCRLALMNSAGAAEIERRYGLANYFEYLEARLGGHGNGVALVSGGRITLLHKGVDFTTEQAAADILGRVGYWDYAIFHTRLASCGVVCDENCHPFRSGDELLAQNGTEQIFTAWGKATGKTDCEGVLRYSGIINDGGTLRETVNQLNSVYVGMCGGKVFAVRNYGRLEAMKTRDKAALCIGSEFPKGLVSYNIESFDEDTGIVKSNIPTYSFRLAEAGF